MSTEANEVKKDLVKRVSQMLQSEYASNAEYNSTLDEFEPSEVPGVQRLKSSEILFWADRDAYHAGLLEWETNHIFDIHEVAIKQLKSSDQLPVFHDLVGAIKRSRIAPFIGAGMSTGSDFPLWSGALEQLVEKIDGLDSPPSLRGLRFLRERSPCLVPWWFNRRIPTCLAKVPKGTKEQASAGYFRLRPVKVARRMKTTVSTTIMRKSRDTGMKGK